MAELIENSFNEVVSLIQKARNNALKSVNRELITLYWQVGEYISGKIESAGWGNKTIENLAEYIQQNQPDIKGFSAQNLWRMKQFYELYRNNEKLSTLLRKISWSNNMLIIGKTKTDEEREFYLKLAIKESYSYRELERQLDSCYYERCLSSGKLLPAKLEEIHPQAKNVFKDNYMLDFLNLPDRHSENDLQTSIVRNLKKFILEFGKDFVFMGQEYRLQVGTSDFFIDLLFYHRELTCLVAFELKIDEFKPEYLGKLNFYLEALDRDVKKQHEKPSIGVLLCKGKNDVIVEYAMSRSISPALIAEYQTKLIDRQILHNELQKLINEAGE